VTSPAIRFERVLLKLSGEALEGRGAGGLDPTVLQSLAEQIKELCELGVQVGVVIGGGNIFRGLKGAAGGMNRSLADGMGMLATVINCLALQDALQRAGQPACTMSAVSMGGMTERFSQRRALQLLAAGEVILLGGGTGNPYFTTDTAAALRALEIGAQAMLKATKVDGIYDKDPVVHSDAQRFERLTYTEVLDRRLRVLDLTAVTLCRDNKLPLVVFDMTVPGNIRKVICGEAVGSEVVGD